MYHGILHAVRGPAAFGDLFISADAFTRHMRHLARAFRVVSLTEVLETFERGRELPERAVLITFDDGYRNTISVALPILRALRFPATVFVVSDMAGRTEVFWYDALRMLLPTCVAQRRLVELGCGISIDGRVMKDHAHTFFSLIQRVMDLRPEHHVMLIQRLMGLCREHRLLQRYPEFHLAGWEEWRCAVAGGLITVGSHGCSHRDLARLSPAERLHDLQESKQRIERELATSCRAVAYPYGAWNEEVTAAARQAGYACGLTTDEGTTDITSDPFALHRTMVGDRGAFSIFCARVSGVWEGLRAMALPRQRVAQSAAMLLQR